MTFRGIITGIAMALPLLFLSCQRPSSDEAYLKAGQTDRDGRYCFELAMDDQSCTYDVDLYLFVTPSDRKYAPFEEETLAEWLSPEDAPYEELVTFSSDTEYQESDISRTYLYHYRKDLVPVVSGSWQLRLTFPEGFEDRCHLSGMGIKLIRKNGTR